MDHRLIGVSIWGSRPSLTEGLVEALALSEVLMRGVPDKVRTSHDPTSETILRAFRERPNTSAREAPKAPAAPQRLGAADVRASVVPLCSQLLLVGL